MPDAESKAVTKKANPSPQAFLNGEIHDWYRTVFGYSDHLVSMLLNRFGVQKDQVILDPFCGSGTTLVESMKNGINSVGIDANPSSYFAAKVKTNWGLTEKRTLELLDELKDHYVSLERRRAKYKKDPTYVYLDDTGMLDRGWISEEPLRKALALKSAILKLGTRADYVNLFFLILLSEVVDSVSNIKFGPTLYCGPSKENVDVFGIFEKKIQKVAADIAKTKTVDNGRAQVFLGDSRNCPSVFGEQYRKKFSAVITSPPYPSEHDYTRNSRLELAFLEQVTGRETLQRIKRSMLRSNTKGIYKEDKDGDEVKNNLSIKALMNKVEPKAKRKKHGFARLYTTVIGEYFGGMQKHLASIRPFLAAEANLAYIVGDQSSYLRVHIPTAQILAEIAQSVGYELVDIIHWRSRWASASSSEIQENILMLRNS